MDNSLETADEKMAAVMTQRLRDIDERRGEKRVLVVQVDRGRTLVVMFITTLANYTCTPPLHRTRLSVSAPDASLSFSPWFRMFAKPSRPTLMTRASCTVSSSQSGGMHCSTAIGVRTQPTET